jgi:hypothetical protein
MSSRLESSKPIRRCKRETSAQGGRQRLPAPSCLVGVLFALKTCTPWKRRAAAPRPRHSVRRPCDPKDATAYGILPAIAKHGTEHGSGVSVHRCVVEGPFAWLSSWRRLLARYENRETSTTTFLRLAWPPMDCEMAEKVGSLPGR